MPPMKHHAINYIELSAPDFAAVKAFYATVFGWAFTDYGAGYLAFNDGTLDGGFAPGTPKEGGALVILYSNNLEASRNAIQENGGTITQDIYSFPGGRRFHFRDPAGNGLAVWSET